MFFHFRHGSPSEPSSHPQQLILQHWVKLVEVAVLLYRSSISQNSKLIRKPLLLGKADDGTFCPLKVSWCQ
jgi:hypothetical protein